MRNVSFRDLETIICDFDGVLTDNKVFVDENGREMVACSRADGLAVGFLKGLGIHVVIVSTERNPVVQQRAKKLKIPAVSGAGDKMKILQQMVARGRISLRTTLYIGNDVNDLAAMKICRWRACPRDAYSPIKRIANVKLKTLGGGGVLREVWGKVVSKGKK